jgi:hypothetical protein
MGIDTTYAFCLMAAIDCDDLENSVVEASNLEGMEWQIKLMSMRE